MIARSVENDPVRAQNVVECTSSREVDLLDTYSLTKTEFQFGPNEYLDKT